MTSRARIPETPEIDAAQIEAVERLLDLVGPLRQRCCPLIPTARQEAFLRLRAREVLFGGAAGGGKTLALLMAGLQYVDVPGYHALILRPSLAEFALPGGMFELASDWLAGSKAHWSSDTNTWRFPGPGRSGAGGASLTFGYLDNDRDLGRYAGSSVSFLGFDELGRFDENTYRRMFRVVRQPSNQSRLGSAPDGTSLADVPIRVRATSNPGGPNHAWIKRHFVDPSTQAEGALFLPARLVHNPHLDSDQYAEALALLPPTERERLLNGDWEIPDEGALFQRGWIEEIDRSHLPENTTAVRFWDLAATEPSPTSPDPDFTVGLRLDLQLESGVFYISDIIRARKPPGAIEQLVAQTAAADGTDVDIVIEQEPGAAGVSLIRQYKAHVLRGYTVRSVRPTGNKQTRARPVAAAAENGLVKLINQPNSLDFLDEISAFPYAAHDDCVDALAGAHNHLSRNPRRQGSIHIPRGNIYELAARNRNRRSPRRTDPHLIRQQAQTEQQALQTLASQLGLPHS
jgi:predicted phage terminase large subunit-like protein